MARKDVPDWLVCMAYKLRHDRIEAGQRPSSVPFPYWFLSQWTGECEKVCYCAMERAEGHGLINCGVSLRTGWLTEEGEKVVEGVTVDMVVAKWKAENRANEQSNT